MVLEGQRIEHKTARFMSAHKLPVGFIARACRHRRADDLEIICFGVAIPIGNDYQAVARGVIIDFLFDAGFARGDAYQRSPWVVRVDDMGFRRFMITR